MTTVRIGTRGSRLAIRQTELITDKLRAHYPDIELQIIEIKTIGDKLTNVSLDKIGGKGVFIKELEDALLDKRIDIAVHSLKDMPGEIHTDLMLAAYFERENPSDVLVSRDNKLLEELPSGAIIGTSSLRRSFEVHNMRNDLKLEPMRGNVNTRLSKLDDGQYDAIVLAAAGLIRLGLESRISEWLPSDKFIPSPGQGIIGIETRKDSKEIVELVKVCDNAGSRIAAICERAFLKSLNGNCELPVGAYCTVKGDQLFLRGLLGNPEDLKVYSDEMMGQVGREEELGILLAERIKERMGCQI